MKSRYLLLTFFAFACLTTGQIYAFKIDPDVALGTEFKPDYTPFLDHLMQPIHERMTALSYLCASQKNDHEACPGDQGQLPPQFEGYADLIHGTRWNDDPNNMFPSNNAILWVFWMGDAQKHMGHITKINPLQYRSHYGDLQFLHAMAMTGDSHAQTQKKLLDWIHFSYAVAAGLIAPEQTMKTLMPDYDFCRNFAGTSKETWSVRTLFLNIMDYKTRGKELQGIADSAIPNIALGALLHTIQDSYSRSHTTREHAASDTASQSGAIEAFLDYSQQNSNCHGPSDLQANWLAQGSTSQFDNPVYYGAWVVRRAHEKQSWQQVEVQFHTIFAITNGAALTNGGNFVKC